MSGQGRPPLQINSRGITLIALVITIIIMLILVTVTVTVALKGGLFATAKQAKVDTENKINEEQNLASGKVEIDGKWYNSIDEYTKEATPKVEGLTPVTKENYGEFVEYGVDLNGDGDYTNDWKVFYVGSEDDGYPETNGKTFIIAADYVTGNKVSENRNQCMEVSEAISKSKMIESTDKGLEDFCYRLEDL